MVWRIHVSEQAHNDIAMTLTWTLERFGERKCREYRELIRLALIEVAADPEATPAKRRPEIHPDAWTFHLSRPGRRARHLLLFRILDDRTVEVNRLLHDAMELTLHLPPDYGG